MMPGKPVAARGKRFSPAELEGARRVRLADVIADDLAVLFCGANPGLSSAAAGAPFATPSDRWWPALYESGFTPRRLAAHEAHELLALGLGLTSLVRRPTVSVAELAKAEFVEGGRLLRKRVLARHPRWLAVLGVTAYRAAFGRPDAAVGLQEDTIGSTRLWILPNPSGLNAHYPPRALATEFARLRVAADLPDRSRRLTDATLCRRKGRTGRAGLAGERFDVVPAARGGALNVRDGLPPARTATDIGPAAPAPGPAADDLRSTPRKENLYTCRMSEPVRDLPVSGPAVEQAVELARRGVITHLTINGERVAAIVPESVLDALRAAEDAEDAAEADAAMEELGESIPWEQVKADLGL
jgi:double-stranded uracil-DNA glycosylase